MSWQQKMCFIREPNMIQEVWIVFDCVTKPFTHGYAFFHVCLRKFLLYLDFVRVQIKIWFKNTPQRLSWDSHLLTTSSKWFLWTPAHWVQGRPFRFFLRGGGGRDGLASEASLSRSFRGGGGCYKPPSRIFSYFELFYVLFEATWARYFSVQKFIPNKAGDPLKINFLSLASLPWLRPCLSYKKQKTKKKTVYK